MRRPSPAMVVALLALIVALGGTSYAAIKLPKNSVGGRQIKNNAISSPKVKDGSLLAKDFGANQLPQGPKGDTGPQGAQGIQGPKGDTGAPGSDAQFNGAAAGGDLAGTYPNPTIKGGAVGPSALGSVPNAHVSLSGVDGAGLASWTETGSTYDWDTDAIHDNATNPSRLTAPIDGVYDVGAQLWWKSPTSGGTYGGVRDTEIRVGAGGLGSGLPVAVNQVTPVTGNATVQNLHGLVKLHAGDFVRVSVYQDGTNVSPDTQAGNSWATMRWVGPLPN